MSTRGGKPGARARTGTRASRAKAPAATAAVTAPAAPPKPPTAAEQKAAAELRAKTARTAFARTERAVKATEKAAVAKQEANAAEIARLTPERHTAFVEELDSHGAARNAIAEERSRVRGEAGKAPKTYEKMLAAEQPYKDAQAAYEALKPISDASKAHVDMLRDRYLANYDRSRFDTFDRMRKEHPDLKAAEKQAWKDSSATEKAKYASWRKEGTYKAARDKLAGKIPDTLVEAHPLRAGALARLRALDAQMRELTGENARRAALDAREHARAELHDAQTALAHPTWKYTLHSEPIHTALYSSVEQWPAAALTAARASDISGNADRHVGDMALRELQHAQGFDGKPDVVSEDELRQHVRAGEVELWRGDTKSSHTDNMIQGEYHAGLGIRGNGTYAQEAGQNGRSVAQSYAKAHGNEGLMIHMTIKSGARVIGYGELLSKTQSLFHEAERAEQAARGTGDRVAQSRARSLKWLTTGNNTSHYATVMGYDAIRIPAHGQWILLNRTALRISHQVHGE